MVEKGKLDFKLSDKEINLIKLIRELDFGEVKIVVQNSEPIRVEELKKSIKL